METKVANESVYDRVVIKTWLIPGPGGDVNNPRWLSSYAVQGGPPISMRGEGVDTQEEAALQAVNTVQAYLTAQLGRMPRPI